MATLNTASWPLEHDEGAVEVRSEFGSDHHEFSIPALNNALTGD